MKLNINNFDDTKDLTNKRPLNEIIKKELIEYLILQDFINNIKERNID